jgi:phosphate starvation-inducible protein PhoH
VRGLTLDKAIVIVDEAQNLNDQEFNSIITRLGEDSRIVFCGDHYQTDLSKRNDESGFNKFMAISLAMDSFEHIEFGIPDIVRGRIVREYLIAKMEYEKNVRSSAR